MTNTQIQSKVKEYKLDITKLEKVVKQWEEDLTLKEVAKLSDDCYQSFVNIQMLIADIKDPEAKQEADLYCYKETYNFLSFIEGKLDTDTCLFLVNKSKNFSHLIKEYSKYCTKTEIKYKIETPGDIKSSPAESTKKSKSKK